jgi:hypothetical protein
VTLDVASTGPGCGVSPPVLHATPLPLGNNGTFSIANAVPSTPGILFASPLAVSALPIGAGCAAYLDLAALTQLFTLTTSPAGSWSVTVTVPSDPLLAGAQFALQAVLLPTAGPLGVDLSNGIVVTLGT